MLAGMKGPELPVAIGILYRIQDVHYDEQVCAQVEEVKAKKGPGDMTALLHSGETWEN